MQTRSKERRLGSYRVYHQGSLVIRRVSTHPQIGRSGFGPFSCAASKDLSRPARKKLVFTYDYMGRRVEKVVSTWNGSAYASAVTTRFVYDGWNLLAELDGDNSNAVKCSYMWGLDLSGSLQGAGGVGGLLTVNPGGTNGYFAVYDGNG